MAGRKPHLLVAGTKEPRQKIWEAIRLFQPGFSINDIARSSGQLPPDVNVYFQALTKAGIIEQIESPKKSKESRVFALVKDEGAEHPRLNSKGERTYDHLAAENIWRTLRIMSGELTIADLIHAASAGGAALKTVKVRQYLNALAESGYLEKIPYSKTTPETYRLRPGKYTGPRPPEIRNLESLQVYDPNVSKMVYTKTTGSVGADRSLVEPGIALLRTRNLLSEWLTLASDSKGATKFPADLVQRTQLELATPGESGGLQ